MKSTDLEREWGRQRAYGSTRRTAPLAPPPRQATPLFGKPRPPTSAPPTLRVSAAVPFCPLSAAVLPLHASPGGAGRRGGGGKMAEASPQPGRFFCHCCSAEIAPRLPVSRRRRGCGQDGVGGTVGQRWGGQSPAGRARGDEAWGAGPGRGRGAVGTAATGGR